MNKIKNYILNGQGLGIKFLAALAILASLVFAIFVRVEGAQYIPYAQDVADQMLPIKIVDGQIVEPLNTFKMAQIRVEGKSSPLALPLVLDTRVSNLDANLLPEGVYVTRTNIYTVTKNQIKVIKLEGNNFIPKGDYTEVFKSWLNWSAFILGVCGIALLFVLYFILTMFYALCAQLIAKITRKDMNFERRMRLSALVLVAAYIVFLPLSFIGIDSSLLFFVVVICALAWFMIKCAPCKVCAQAEAAKVEVAAKAEVVEKKAQPAAKKPAQHKAKAAVKKEKVKAETKEVVAEKKEESKAPAPAKKKPGSKPAAKKVVKKATSAPKAAKAKAENK